MRRPRAAEERLAADLQRLERHQLVIVELETIEHLLVDPERNPFEPRRGPAGAGLDDVGLTLCAAPRLPDHLTVRVMLPSGATSSVPLDRAQAAMQSAAADRSAVAWREGMAVRSMGRRQTPLGLVVAFVAAIAAYGFGFLVSEAGSTLVKLVYAMLGGISITISWLVSWMVIELAVLDWRQSGREATAYDLLSRATLEVTSASSAPAA